MINIARDNLIDLNEVARRLGLKVQTVRLWVKRGTLYAVRVGGRWYTSEKCLNAMAITPQPPSQSEQPATHPLAVADENSYQNIRSLLGRNTQEEHENGF